MGSKPTQLKDGVKPTENTRGGTGGVPSQSSAPEQPSQTILS